MWTAASGDMSFLSWRSSGIPSPLMISEFRSRTDGYYEGGYRATHNTAEPTISMRTTPFFGEDGNLEVGSNREDISERVKAEEEQSRFAALVEHSNDLIGIASLDGKCCS